MSSWEALGLSDEWYTPAYVFKALACEFDLDVAHPAAVKTHVPARQFYSANSLMLEWTGFVWMNPPFGGRNALAPWLDKFFQHGCGIGLTPDRTSAPWWQASFAKCDAILHVRKKIRFLRPDGSEGKSPGTGTTLWASGPRAMATLTRAASAGLGCLAVPA